MSEADLVERLETARQKLFTHREQRIHPHKDDKILTDWKGLMIAALARAGRALDRPEYTAAARNAAEFILARMRQADGRLLHRYRDGDAGITANLNDYAFFIWGLIDLYESAYDAGHLETALELNQIMLTHFWDEEGGGLYFTPDDGEQLLVRLGDVVEDLL